MKTRQRVIGIFLAIVVLCLGIGFAALTTDLLIDGNLTVKETDVSNTFDSLIYFDNPKIAASTVTGETGADLATLTDSTKPKLTEDSDKLTITIPAGTFSAVGQVVNATVDIINESTTNDATVKITATTVGTDTSSSLDLTTSTLTVGSFEVTLTLPGDNPTIPKKSGSTNGKLENVAISIKLAKLPTADETGTFQFKLTATAA